MASLRTRGGCLYGNTSECCCQSVNIEDPGLERSRGAAGLGPEEAAARINTEGSSDLPEKMGFFHGFITFWMPAVVNPKVPRWLAAALGGAGRAGDEQLCLLIKLSGKIGPLTKINSHSDGDYSAATD